MLNDYDFVKDPAKSGDTRWIHRPKMRWDYLEALNGTSNVQEASIRRRLFESIQKLIRLRKASPAFARQTVELITTDNMHTLGFLRSYEGHRMIVLANFSEEQQQIEGNRLRMVGLGRFFEDVITNQSISCSQEIEMEPYQVMWLDRR